MAGALSSVAQGAAAGSVIPGVGTVAGAAIGLIPAAFKFFSGKKQRRQANGINPVDPTFQMNNQVIDNARILENRYNNYQMPGYGSALNNIQTNTATAFSQGVQGATSGGDVLDLATRLAYGQNQATNNLSLQSAQGREAALGQYLNANAAAGDQYQQKNAYQRQMYDRQLAEKAALLQSGNENMYGAIDQAAQVASKGLMPRAGASDASASSSVDRAKLQALLAGYTQSGVADSNGDLYQAGSVGINQNPTGALPSMGGQGLLWKQLNSYR